MGSARTAPRNQRPPLPPPPGLKLDGGWVDALKELLESRPAQERAHWEKLVELARDAHPREKGDWADLEITATNLCGYPDYNSAEEPDYEPNEAPFVIPGLPAQEPHPEPGTAAYDAVLKRCWPDDAWLKKVSDPTISRQIS